MPKKLPLQEYRRKRHFNRTAEPAGKKRKSAHSGWRFVIQKHAASHLHYDFRLEHDGVLKSWAVPHGPSLDPSQRRLAVQVEDHPLEYGKFEGTIPAGEYGGGSVLLWDTGTWSSEQDVSQALRSGKLKFQLEGEKLTGGWNLVRMQKKAGEKRENWLLIKERDESAQPLSKIDILEERPESVVSGRTIGEIGATSDKTWHSHAAGGKKERSTRQKTTRQKSAGGNGKPQTASNPPAGARRVSFPKPIDPQLATLVDHAPAGDEWVHEIKLDGYRILTYLDRGKAILRTRKHNDWTRRFPELAESVAELSARQGVLDGEVVALLANGASDFQALQTALSEQRTSQLVYYVFDLLYLDGFDLRPLPLEERKSRLAELLTGAPHARIRYSEHLEGDGDQIIAKSCQLGLEGIVSKRRHGAYVSGRGDSWLKTKCAQRQEFVIGGFTDSASSRKGLGALLVGYFDKQGDLIYSGKVGTGFSALTEQDVRERLKAREQAKKSFSNVVKDEHKSTTHWIKPELVAEVKYSNWTEAGQLRQPVFQGLREDKPAREVVLERPAAKEGKKRPERQPIRQRTAERRKKTPAHSHSPTISLTGSQERELEGMRLTHPDRVLYPDVGLTKKDLVTYYAEVSEWMLPHVIDRPLSLVRCPEGQTGQCFYQKHASAGTPEALKQVMIREKNKEQPYLMIQNLAGLLSLVQMGVLEVHPWGSSVEDVEKPDRLIFDFDPDPSVPWPDVIAAAKDLKARLTDLGLESFAKTSGGKGLHLVIPIQRRYEWPEAKRFCKAIATQFATDFPKRFTANMSKAERHGKIFVDYLRNDRGATAVAPYSTRSRPGAPVATPLQWSEVKASIRSDHFHVGNVPHRLQTMKGDPWEEMASVRQSLTREMFRQVGLK
jgi:bifunctional non-homologous end joining protein LigD